MASSRTQATHRCAVRIAVDVLEERERTLDFVGAAPLQPKADGRLGANAAHQL